MIIFVGSLYLIFDRKRVQKLPENPADRLETSARIAVQAVEQLYTHNPGKKELAIARIADLYKEWDLPVPSRQTIGLAIESAVLLLPKSDEPQKSGE
jgi:hypothetical protein